MSTFRHSALAPSHPGELIQELMETMGIGKAEMARRLGVTRAALYNVLDGKSALTADMAVRFEAVTKASADLLVNMQAAFDLAKARSKFKSVA